MKKTILFIILFLFSFISFGFDQKYPEHFINIMKSVLLFEGGFSDILDDPGGATNFGVTQQTYDFYRLNKNLSQQTVKNITIDEVYDCYYRFYYLSSGCDTLSPALAFVHFDCSVNFGVSKSKKLFLQSINKLDTLDKKLAFNYIEVRKNERYEIVKRNEKKRKFLKGWLARDEKIRLIIEQYY